VIYYEWAAQAKCVRKLSRPADITSGGHVRSAGWISVFWTKCTGSGVRKDLGLLWRMGAE